MEMLLILVAIGIPFGVVAILIWLVTRVKHLQGEILVLKSFSNKVFEEFERRQKQPVETTETPSQAPLDAAKHTPQDSAEKTTEKAALPPRPISDNNPAFSRKVTEKPSPQLSILDKLTNMNVLIWIGGAALALGGIFIVKYSIEHGLLGPWGRVLSGLVLGSGMLGVGEWFRRQPEHARNLTSWKYLPLVVSAAGFATIYGAIFAGFALYLLFPPIIALLLMAVTAGAGLAYSLLLGPILALLALIGGYSVPALVSTNAPSTELLYLYLGAVLCSSFLLLRYRPWTWIGSFTLIASLLWFLAWSFAVSPGPADVIVVTVYFVVLLGLYIYQFAGKVQRRVRATSFLLFTGLMETAGWQIYGAMSYGTVAGIILAFNLDFEPVSYLLLLGLLPLAVWLSTRDHLLEGTLWITHFGALVLVFFWPAVPLGGAAGDVNVWLVSISILIGVFYVGVGGWRVHRQDRAFLGALNSLASPLLIFCLLFWKYNGIGVAPEWSLVALALAGGYAWAASYVAKIMPRAQGNPLIGLMAIGATSGLSLAFGAGLEAEWLTIAFATQTAAIAWINRKIPVAMFRPLAALLAIIVIVRLELDSEVVRLFLGVQFEVDWYLYGYGVAILAFSLAWFWFRAEKTDYLVYLLESGLVLFWVTLITLVIREGSATHLKGGSFFLTDFREGSIHTFSMLLNALGLYWLCTKSSNIVREWGWRILGSLGLFSLIFGQLLVSNPLLDNGPVGDWIVFNWLAFGYVAPAVILTLGFKIAREPHKKYGIYGLSFAGFLGFFYINAEIRHFFSPEQMALGRYSDTEFYAYSVGWLLYASAIMLLGIWKKSPLLRRAALFLLLVTVFKVFFFDMATLDGLLRAASFLGLGVCLIGLAFLYQRFGREDDLSKLMGR